MNIDLEKFWNSPDLIPKDGNRVLFLTGLWIALGEYDARTDSFLEENFSELCNSVDPFSYVSSRNEIDGWQYVDILLPPDKEND